MAEMDSPQSRSDILAAFVSVTCLCVVARHALSRWHPGIQDYFSNFPGDWAEIGWSCTYRHCNSALALKRQDGFQYWEYVLCYVDDLLAISDNPTRIMKSIQLKFSLKDDKMEKPENYLGADMSEMYNADGDLCWAMSLDKYCQAPVKNVEADLEKKGIKLPSKCYTPTN